MLFILFVLKAVLTAEGVSLCVMLLRNRPSLFNWYHTLKSKRCFVCLHLLTFPKIHSLEHVGLADAVRLGRFEELGDLLHLFEGHGGVLDLLHWFVFGKQAVHQTAQNLGR